MKLINFAPPPLKAFIIEYEMHRPLQMVYVWEDWGRPHFVPLNHLATISFRFQCPCCGITDYTVFNYNQKPYIACCRHCNRELLLEIR